MRRNGVKGEGYGREQSPDKRQRGDMQGAQFELCGTAERTQGHQQHRCQLIPPGRTPLLHNGVDQDHHRCHVREHRGEGGVRVLDGSIVAILAKGGANEAKGDKGRVILFVLPHRHGVLSGQGRKEHQEGTRQQQADGDNPIRGNPVLFKQGLATGTADGPADAA